MACSSSEVSAMPALVAPLGLLSACAARLRSTLRSGNEFGAVFVNRRKNGEVFHEEESIRPFADALGNITHFVASGRDVSERIHALERLDYLANHDSLTGLPNRNLFSNRMHQAMTRVSRHGADFALLYLDLDRFKTVNDRHGHAAGDALLQAVALRLKQCVREEDTVARTGGDEFALLLSDIACGEDARKVIDKILASLRHGVGVEGWRVSVSVSIGVCFFPADGNDQRSLLTHADRAVCRAKSAGGDGYRFFASEYDTPCCTMPPQEHSASRAAETGSAAA